MKNQKISKKRHSQKSNPHCGTHFAATALALLMMSGLAWGYPGDRWILPVDHRDGSGWTVTLGEGYDGASSYEGNGANAERRIYWALNGLSIGTSNAFPTTTELYTIEFFRPYGGPSQWQPIESQFHAVNGELFPYDPSIPWAGVDGTSHQYIGAENGTPGEWTTTGTLGPHTPDSADYNACGKCANSIYMWLTRGSWLYAKWDFPWPTANTWSALRLTQVTGVSLVPVILSVNQDGGMITLTWSAISGKMYQVQYRTNLIQTNWSNLGTSILATNITATAADNIGPDAQRFYRVALLP